MDRCPETSRWIRCSPGSALPSRARRPHRRASLRRCDRVVAPARSAPGPRSNSGAVVPGRATHGGSRSRVPWLPPRLARRPVHAGRIHRGPQRPCDVRRSRRLAAAHHPAGLSRSPSHPRLPKKSARQSRPRATRRRLDRHRWTSPGNLPAHTRRQGHLARRRDSGGRIEQQRVSPPGENGVDTTRFVVD